jgi:hypothetical protein
MTFCLWILASNPLKNVQATIGDLQMNVDERGELTTDVTLIPHPSYNNTNFYR